MIPQEVHRMKSILDSFLGESKQELTESYELEYPCPRCIDKYGHGEARKYNLSVSLSKQVYHCWKCSDEGENGMSGSIMKLIHQYGTPELSKEYREAVDSLRQSSFFQVTFGDNSFKLLKGKDTDDSSVMLLPKKFRYLKRDKYYPTAALEYLNSRGINWDIIEKYHMGYTLNDKEKFMESYRVYIPSYDKYGELNYWTGRDYMNRDNIAKYYNVKAERKEIIFNEDKIQWDADITLVEGPFDHIVVPNSIPLLGKVLTSDFKLYWEIIKNAKANINIFLDADAYESVKSVYKALNHGNLYNRIRYIPVEGDLDPSKIYELYGNKGIIQHLRNAKQISEVYLL